MVSRHGELECERAFHCLTAGTQRNDQDTVILDGCSPGGHKSLHLSQAFSAGRNVADVSHFPRLRILFNTTSHKTGVMA